MESSPSAQDLERAIMELDGMYHDLNESYRRHSQVEMNHRELAQFQSSDDDEDYDIPRPAEGFFNTTPKPRFKPMSIEIDSEEDYQVLPKSPTRIDESIIAASLPKSPTTPARSEDSSGLGTLPKENDGPPVETEFPGPPQFEAPPPPDSDYDEVEEMPPSTPHLPFSDSDYDEVASTSSSSSSSSGGSGPAEDFVYSQPSLKTRRKSSEGSVPDYAVINKSGTQLSNDIIADDERRISSSSDYAEVYSVPSSQRSSTAVKDDVHSQTDQKIPMVVQMKRIDRPSVKFVNETHQRREQDQEEHSFIIPQVQFKAPSTDRERKVPGYAHEVIESKLPMGENSNIEHEANQSRSDSTTSTQEPALPYRPRSFRNESKKKSAMDAEAQRRKKLDKGPQCPCECRAAVPLMSVAVVICIAIFMLTVIGYVYFGIRNDEYIANSRNQGNEIPPEASDTTTISGNGV